MRTKPDISQFAGAAKDPNDFLDGASAESPPPAAAPLACVSPAPADTGVRTMTIEVTKPEPTVQKLFRLNWELANALKIGAARESAASGRRVTETEIVERLLRTYYKLDS